jgi:hypothetical protein
VPSKKRVSDLGKELQKADSTRRFLGLLPERSAEMPHALKRPSSTSAGINVGAALFLLALAGSALVVPQLRLLHLLQSFIYLAVVIFARSANTYALGAGVTIAVAWNSIEIFGPRLVQAGAALIWTFLHTGHAQHIETMMVFIGAIGHFVLMTGCLATLLRQPGDSRKWWKFVAGGVLVLGYFALIVVIAGPRPV